MILGREVWRAFMQCFSNVGVLLNGFIFLNSFLKCANCCQHKAHQQGHLQRAGTKSRAVRQNLAERTGPFGRQLGFLLPGVLKSNFFIYIFYLRIDLKPKQRACRR